MATEPSPAEGRAERTQWPLGPRVALASVPAAAFEYTTLVGDLTTLTQVHVVTGTVWTVLVLCIGFVVARLLGERGTASQVSILRRVVPVSTALLPVRGAVGVVAGLELAVAHDLAVSSPLLPAVLGVTGVVADGEARRVPHPLKF